MKTLKFFILSLLITLGNLESNGQATISRDTDVKFYLINPESRDTLFFITATLDEVMISSSGNYLRKVSFELDKNHPLMNFSGPVKRIEVSMYADIDNDGDEDKVTDTLAILTRSGKLKFVFHSNGAGNALPNGW